MGEDWRAAKAVELRARMGWCFARLLECGVAAAVAEVADGSSARSHIAAEEWERVMRSRPVEGVPDRGGSMNAFLMDVGVGGVRPIPLLTRVLPLLEPEPSRRPEDEAGRRKFMPMPEARETLRLPFVLLAMPETSTSSQARTSSSASWRTRTAESWSTSQRIRS